MVQDPSLSPLHLQRLNYQPQTPIVLHDLQKIVARGEQTVEAEDDVKRLFPNTCKNAFWALEEGKGERGAPRRVGVVFSGGQAAGGHNVVWGLYEGLKALHPESRLIGFLGGPSGIIDNKTREITLELLHTYKNTGGFDLIGSGRTKIEKEEQFAKALNTIKMQALDGLVVIGGDDSNTNAAWLSEFFIKEGVKTQVIGVPKTIDGDLRAERLEISFGFDTAYRVYSELIGNIARDALSAGKYYHFIKLMGRAASHIALACALETHPNVTLIGEEIAKEGKSLATVVEELVELIVKRAAKGKNYGVILIPEGVIEFIPELNALIKELNALLAKNLKVQDLSSQSRATWDFLPSVLQEQLLLERDAHGNVQVSQIATEKLLLLKVKEALKQRTDYLGKFNALKHFFGYEGRSAFPTNFDADYGFTLGKVAAALLHLGATSTLATAYNLTAPVASWKVGGIPLTSLLHFEERKGKQVPVIKKALVDLEGSPFTQFAAHRSLWALDDHYRYPGPIQY